MLLRFVVLLCAGHAVAWSAKASLVGLGKEPEPSHLQPTITASAMLGGVRPTGIRVPHQVILVHPSDDLVSVLSYASSGDVLLLASGVYTPAATGDFGLQINKNITIAAQQTGQAVLDGQNERTVLSITAGFVHLKGLNITNGVGTQVGGGIFISGGTVAIETSQIFSNTASFGNEGGAGGGIAIEGGTVNINDCAIHNNQAPYGGGVIIAEDAATTVSNCTISGNQATSGGGIYVQHGAQVKLDNQSVVTSNKPDGCYGFWSWPACNKQ